MVIVICIDVIGNPISSCIFLGQDYQGLIENASR